MATKMKIGINLPGKTVHGCKAALVEQLNIFEDAKFDGVEISPGSLNLIKNGVLDKKESSNVLDILSNYNFSYTVHVPMRVNLASPLLLEVSEKIMRSCIDFCTMANAKVLVVHSGYVVPVDKISELEALKVLISSLQKLSEYACDSGVLIGVENGDLGPTHLCREIDKLIEVIRRVDMNNIGITFDFGHAFIAASYYKFNFLDAVREAAPYMFHLHINDNYGKFDPLSPASKNVALGYGDLHLPIGWGKIPYEDVFRLIKRTYKHGLYLLEIDDEFREYYQYAITKLREMLQKV